HVNVVNRKPGHFIPLHAQQSLGTVWPVNDLRRKPSLAPSQTAKTVPPGPPPVSSPRRKWMNLFLRSGVGLTEWGLRYFNVRPRNISRKDRFYSVEGIHMTFALLKFGLNPFDPKTVLVAKHAQHVVLIHFPIALFISAVAFDLVEHWTKGAGLKQATYYNLLVAALATIPVLATGILAWQLQLEGQKLKGILLMHLVLASVSTVIIWLVWWL